MRPKHSWRRALSWTPTLGALGTARAACPAPLRRALHGAAETRACVHTGSSLSRRPRAVVTVRTYFFTLCMDVPPYLCPVPCTQELAHSQVLANFIILPQRRHELAAVKYRAFREAMTLQNLASCGERCPGESAGEARSCCVLAFDNPECGPTVSYAEPSWVGKEKQELRRASVPSMGGRGSLAPLVSALKQRGGFTTWLLSSSPSCE